MTNPQCRLSIDRIDLPRIDSSSSPGKATASARRSCSANPKTSKTTPAGTPPPKPEKIPDEKGVVTFCWTPVSLFFDYAMSPSSRLRLAMLVPKASLIRSSRYQRMYPSNCSTNPSMVTPVKLRPWKNFLLRDARRTLPRPRCPDCSPSHTHRPGQPVLPADADPPGPPVVATAVGVDDRTPPRPRAWRTRRGASGWPARRSGSCRSSRPPASRRSSRSPG